MDGELPPWNKHGSHNSGVPYNIAGECQENHDLIGDSFAAGEPMSSLSSCMSGAFEALLPDYHGTSSEMTTSSVKYSYSPNNNCHIKPGTAVDEKMVVESREKSDFLKDPLCEASASVTHMLPPKCAQYVPQEKDQDQGNCNWTSVIKDSLEMSNGMEMEQSLSMDVCGPLMGFNPVYKGSETEAKFTLKDHYQIAGSKLNEKQNGQGVKGEPDSFISMLSGGISKKKDVLEMGENDEPSILDVGTSLGTEELGMTGIRENEPRFLPDFNRSSYTPFSSSEGFMKREEFLDIPSVKQSIEHTLQGPKQEPKTCRDVSPRKTGGTNICFRHATVNNEAVLEGSSVYGLHRLDLQKDFHQAEVIDGNTFINSQDHSFEHDVQDKRVNTSDLYVSETTLIEKSAACLPDTLYFGSKLKHQDHDPLETGSAPEIQNFSSGSETAPDQTVIANKIHLDYKCKDSKIEPWESGKLNPSAVLLPCDEKVQNSEKIFLNITSENRIPPPTENVHAAPSSPTSRIDCSFQPNLKKALQKHKKSRKRKKSELEELNGPTHNSKKDDCSVYGSEISDSAVKPDTIGCEDTNQNFSLTNHCSTAVKDEDLIKNEVNPPSSRSKSLCHSQLQMTNLELVAETSQKPDQSCSQVKVPSTAMTNRKAVSRRKLKNKTRLRLKAKKSTRLDNQCLPQGAVLTSKEDCTSHFQVSEATLLKDHNPTIIKQAISKLESSIAECSPEKSTLQTKKYALQTLQSKSDLHDDPTTLSEVETDLMDSKKHQKVRRHGIKASKGKTYEHATSLLNSQSLQESVSQTDSVSISVTESSNILNPQKNPTKSRQKKRVNINKATKSPQKDIPLPLSKTKKQMGISNTRTVKAKISVRKPNRTDDCDTTLLDIQPSLATLKQTDSLPIAEIKVESPVVFRTHAQSVRKSLKNKLSDIKHKAVPTVDQTTAHQSVLNPLSESDDSIVQPTMRRFSPRKTLDTVSKNYETAHLNESISLVDSIYSTVTEISGVSLMNTEKTSSKWRETNIKFMEEQTSTTSQKEDVIVLPSEDFASIVVSNSEKNVKAKKLSRNNTNDTHLDDNLFEDTSLLAFVTQENSISPSKIDCSISVKQTSTLKKPRKKTVTKTEAEEILNIKQHEDFVAITSKPSANIVASNSQMTLKEKRPVENAITEEVKDSHATLFGTQTSTAPLQHTGCVLTSFAHSPPKKSKKMSEPVHPPEVDQSMQQELHPFDCVSATEMDNSDISNQNKIKVKTKRLTKKVTKCKTHVTQANSSIREQSFPATVQQEYSVSNRSTNSRSDELTKKLTKKKTSTLKVRNVQPEDHPTVLSELLPQLIPLGKDATHDSCIKTDFENESAKSPVEKQVFITTEDATCTQSLLKAKKTQEKLVQKEDKQSNILELAHREDKMSDAPSVVRDVAFEHFEPLEAQSCDQQKKAQKSKTIEETHEFANVSLSQDKNTGSDEAGVMVTFTQIQDICNIHDDQAIGSQQPEKDEFKEESRIKDCKATKKPKTKSRKGGRKMSKIAGLLTQTVKEEDPKDISNNNGIASDFQNNTQIPISDSTQRIAIISEELVMKSRKSTCPQKIDLGPFVENVSTQGSLDITECHTRLGETLSGSMQPADCKGQITVEQKSPTRGRPPSIKNKRQKLSIANLEDNTSPTVQISDLSSCQDGTETLSSFMQPTDCEGQYTIKQKSQRRRRPLSIKSKKQRLSIAHLEDNTSPTFQISDLSSCQDSTETLSSSMQPADCEGQYTIKQKSPRRGRLPSIKSKKQRLSIANLEDKTSPLAQISDIFSCQDGTETLSSSMEPADCEGQNTIKKKSPRQGRSPSNKSKKQKLSVAHLEDNASPPIQISDFSSCQDGTETLSSSMEPADCEGQYTIKKKSPRQGRSPSNKSKKHKLSMAHLEDNASPSIQILDLSSCQDGTETLSSSMEPADCEGQYTIKKKSPRQVRSPSNKSKKHKLSMAHLEDNGSPSIQISDLSSCQDGIATLSSSIKPADCESLYTIKQKSPRQGRSPSNKSKKHKLSIAYLEENASPSVQISDLSSCQDGTVTLSSSMESADCESQYTIKQKSPRQGRSPSNKSKKHKLSIAYLEENASPSVQISDLSSCQDGTATLSSSMESADCESQYTIKQKSPRQGRSPSNKSKKHKLSIAHLKDNASPSIQISDLSSCQDSTATLSSSMEPTDCEGQYTIKQKSPRRGRPPSIKNKKQKLSIAHLEDNTSPTFQILDRSSSQDSIETLSSSKQPADCEGQYTKQKLPRRGRPPSIKNKKQTLSIAHLEDNVSPSVQISDLSSCQESAETLSSSMQPADCEGQYTKRKSPRRGRPPSIKNEKQTLSIAHLEDNISPSVQISDLPSCQDSTENKVKAASPVKQKVVQKLKKRKVVKVKNITVTRQLGTDPSESLQSLTGDMTQIIPVPKHKKGKNFKSLRLSSLRVSSRTPEPSVKGFQKADVHSLPQNSTNDFNEEAKKSLPKPGTAKKQKHCEKTAILDDDSLADIKIENKAKVRVVKGGKRGRKRRKMKEPVPDLVTEQEELQRLTTKTKNNKGQDCSEPAKSLLKEFSITNECSTDDQNNIVTSEKKDVKTKLSSVEMIPAITVETFQITPKTEVQCSSSTYPYSNLMKEDKHNEHNAEANVKDLFAVNDKTGISGGVSSGICNLISSNVGKEESENIFLDTKIKPNIELKCTQKTDGPNVEMSREIILDNISEIENAFQTSTEQKVDGFTQDSEECLVMLNKVSNKRTMRSTPKEIMKKPLTCKYCGVSFRHITAYTIHQRIHTGDKPYKCKNCGKTFAQLSKLKSHRNVHKQDTSFPCPCCSQRFLQKEILLRHFEVHLQESKTNSKPQKDIKSMKNTSSDVCSETPNNYRCLICKKNFANDIKLQNHMQSHEVEKPLTCKDCGKKFWKPSSLAAHEKSHWPVKPYACSICGKGFNQLKALKKHSQDHAGETPFSCFHCGHGFSTLSALRLHQASKTCIARRNDGASGNIEGFIVSQGVDGQVNTPVFFKCQICKQLFRKWCQYTLHLQTHTSSPPYICFSCGQCYEKDSEMNVHCEVCCQSSGEEQICGASLSEIMQGITYPLKCSSSQTLPSAGFQLNSQTQTNSEQLPQLPKLMDVEPTQTRHTDFSQLPKTYSTQSPVKLPVVQLPTHSHVNCTSTSSPLECVEITPSHWKFKCPRCGQRFERYRTLSAHLQMHAPGFRYTCGHCGQFFERWSKLWLHQRRHRLKSRCYSCNQCNLQFRFFSSFKEHMIDHAGQRPFACPLCPKTFIQEASLHAHQCESHKLCKSLKCDVCSKTFSNLANLIKHSLLHNGSTSHICLPCNLSFTNTRVLKEHLKTHTTYAHPTLPEIPSKPLDFPHKCKRCKSSFSTGDLLYAHQIRHSRDAKTPAIVPTSKLSNSCDTSSSTRRNHISNLKLDGIPNDESLYVYSHPDRLYVPQSRKVQIPVIDLDPDEQEEVSDSQNITPEIPNSEITAQSDSTHLPQTTAGQETTNLNLSESEKEMENGEHNYSCKLSRRPRFVETSVDMEVEMTAQEEESLESFECADCTEKLSSVLSLYEHYILHAMGDTYVH
ncbi:uncharacterized protein si:ch73-347e22.4 isoform X2 [Pseudorasbora parva]|uniref:uncharacterized protein si:ch73-347e22.4 isoform X2 n=1 Tax=Pseudorasbora parva TaxID=51549 RepID=UPI00351F2E8B